MEPTEKMKKAWESYEKAEQKYADAYGKWLLAWQKYAEASSGKKGCIKETDRKFFDERVKKVQSVLKEVTREVIGKQGVCDGEKQK